MDNTQNTWNLQPGALVDSVTLYWTRGGLEPQIIWYVTVTMVISAGTNAVRIEYLTAMFNF